MPERRRRGEAVQCPVRPTPSVSVKDAAVAETADSAEWQARAKGLLKAELKRRGVTYAQLAPLFVLSHPVFRFNVSAFATAS